MKRLKLSQVLLLLFAILSVPTSAFSLLEIQYAGFAFRGDNANIQKNYPYSYALSQEKAEDGRSVLEIALLGKAVNAKLINANLVVGNLSDTQQDGLVLACSLGTELVSIEQHDDGFKIVIDLGAQAILFDYREMRVVANYPIMVELIDYVPQRPDEALIASRIRDLFLSDKYGVNLFNDFVQILETVELKRKYGQTLQVCNVVVEEKALSFLPDQFRGDLGNFQTFVAQGFGKYLSKNQKVSVLPYAKGSDIGNKMALRFSDARVYQLEIPKPTFEVEVTVRGFKKVCTEEKKSGSCYVYGAFTNLKVVQPLLGKVYLDERFKYGIDKVVPSTQKTIEDWPSFQNSLMALFNDLTKKISEEGQFSKLREVIKKCS